MAFFVETRKLATGSADVSFRECLGICRARQAMFPTRPASGVESLKVSVAPKVSGYRLVRFDEGSKKRSCPSLSVDQNGETHDAISALAPPVTQQS